MVNILQAAKNGDTSEFTKLLSESKKPRKKRVKRLNTKSDIADKPSHQTHQSSPLLNGQRDPFLFSMQHYQQQYPFQWVRL